jgi:glycosyltransferase involved in cell wall biosynthesis
MKILWFNWRCWLNPSMGGAEVFTYEVAKRWVAHGNDVTLFTSEYEGCKKEECIDGIKIIRAGGRFGIYEQAKKAYQARFRHEDFDVVIDEINTQPFFAQKFVKNHEKVVALIHQLAREFWFYETPFPVSYVGYHFLENRWLKQYVNIPTVTVSESTRKDLKALGFRNVSIVPEGLNFKPLSDLSEKESKPVVAFSGRLKHAKRPDHAIKAFEIIKQKVPDAELWVFGDGPFRKQLEDIAGSGVKFFGNIDSVERRALLKKCSLLLVSGVREGWGLNVIEANALGTPAVAYDAPGLCDSVRNCETGLLAKNGDIEDLACKSINVLTDAGLKEKLSLNALNYSKQFSWDKTAECFFKLINND